MKSKQQLDVRNINLSNTVLCAQQIISSELLLVLLRDVLNFASHDKTACDICEKKEFKEIIIRECVLLNDVKVDVFLTPNTALLLMSEHLLSEPLLSQFSAISPEDLSDRYMSPFRTILSLDRLLLKQFQIREH